MILKRFKSKRNFVYIRPHRGDDGDIDRPKTMTELPNLNESVDAFSAYYYETNSQPGRFTAGNISDTGRTFLMTPYKAKNLKLTIPELICQVEGGWHIYQCIQAPPQDLQKSEGLLQKPYEGVLGLLEKNYKRNEDGILEMINTMHQKKQKKVLAHLIKQYGSYLFANKSIMSISLPISVFEPRSHLERVANSFTYAPHFLEKAGFSEDPLEQFKLTITHWIASLHTNLNPQKPFNPILGETYQGLIDGCPVYVEHISKEPSTCCYQMYGRTYRITGNCEFNITTGSNCVMYREDGYPKVYFVNTGVTVIASLPLGTMQGIVVGKTTFNLSNKLFCIDPQNKFYAEINFNVGSAWTSKKRRPKDYISGTVWKVSDSFIDDLLIQMAETKRLDPNFKESEHAAIELASIEGSWLQYLDINKTRYWTLGKELPYVLCRFDNPLPSDSNYRLDILHLKAGNEIKAQEAMNSIEDKQRRDDKLRGKQVSPRKNQWKKT